jgi:NADPH:quinone reductase-like Zn-dependent oxidoreductase
MKARIRHNRIGPAGSMNGESRVMATETTTSMRAVVQARYGAPEQVLGLLDIDQPPLGGEDVLIRMRATSVNTPDWIAVTGTPYITRLQFGLRRPSNPVRGSDVAGTVEAVGKDVTDLNPGDEVFGSIWANKANGRTGTFAELTVVPASQLVKKPATLSFEEAAASVMSGVTALVAMRDVGKVGLGTRVLINGASGGVGTFAVQIAKAFGAEVTGVSSSRNLDLVRSLGADHLFDYTVEDFTRTGPYDVILDNVLNHSPKATAKALTPNGILIPNSVGNTGGLFAGLPRMARAAIMGWGSTEVRFVNCVVNRENLEALAGLINSGSVKVIIDKVYGLSETGAAVAHMLGHHARGNIVISMT